MDSASDFLSELILNIVDKKTYHCPITEVSMGPFITSTRLMYGIYGFSLNCPFLKGRLWNAVDH